MKKHEIMKLTKEGMYEYFTGEMKRFAVSEWQMEQRIIERTRHLDEKLKAIDKVNRRLIDEIGRVAATVCQHEMGIYESQKKLASATRMDTTGPIVMSFQQLKDG